MVEDMKQKGIHVEALFKKVELSAEEKAYRQHMERYGDEINGLVFEIHERGVVLKDIGQGLVDFFAKIGGRDVFLCWKLGETEISFWHDLDSGFAGRKSLLKKEFLESVTKVH